MLFGRYLFGLKFGVSRYCDIITSATELKRKTRVELKHEKIYFSARVEQ